MISSRFELETFGMSSRRASPYTKLLRSWCRFYLGSAHWNYYSIGQICKPDHDYKVMSNQARGRRSKHEANSYRQERTAKAVFH